MDSLLILVLVLVFAFGAICKWIWDYKFSDGPAKRSRDAQNRAALADDLWARIKALAADEKAKAPKPIRKKAPPKKKKRKPAPKPKKKPAPPVKPKRAPVPKKSTPAAAPQPTGLPPMPWTEAENK